MAASAISYLFVPASRPDRYQKALMAGADSVIIDLEDAVALEDKDSSLAQLVEALESGLAEPVHVRINAADTEWFERDLHMLAGLSAPGRAGLAGVFVPKVENIASLERVRRALGDRGEVIALIESAAGLSRLRELAGAPRLTRLGIGAADLSFDLDVEIASSTIDYVYAQLVVESRLAGLLGPVASPPFSISEAESTCADARRLRALGATAQLAIHPAQLDPIHTGFRPNDEQVRWARRVVTSVGGAAQIDGQMVDKPVRERAERILAQVDR
ncbi:CoA ester lyase [Arthrobacter bambusae]|uniref:HpcH/HpaI aldolase/citrate lyase family protein n=1 Tax=Arthrobacter bambusae TaxID=1338426 RepID=UPI001F50B224|nr:CoA ester lyase [Arthrobacter bambusae]MCI0142596.1 CoA ester lyase [Arthrobacter bambusae]